MPRLKQFPDWVDYIIQPGDTLSHIAMRQNTTVAELMANNHQIENKDLIYAGHTMKIPLSDAKDIRGAIGVVRNLHGYSEDQYIAAAQILADELERHGRILRQLSLAYWGKEE